VGAVPQGENPHFNNALRRDRNNRGAVRDKSIARDASQMVSNSLTAARRFWKGKRHETTHNRPFTRGLVTVPAIAQDNDDPTSDDARAPGQSIICPDLAMVLLSVVFAVSRSRK
jgi:hypothetical protein